MAFMDATYRLLGVVRHKGDWYFACCPPLDITTQGRTEAEAKANLQEAAEFFMTSCIERGTLDQALKELGFIEVGSSKERIPANAFRMEIRVPMRFQKNAPCHA